MKALWTVKEALHRIGIDVSVYEPRTNHLLRRRLLLKHFGTTLVLDVGANAGNYAVGLRRLGYEGRIVSFEPLRSAYARLVQKAQHDTCWQTVPEGLGNAEGTAMINIAGNSESSSFLEMLPSHVAVAPESRYVGKESVTIRRLDSVFPSYANAQDRVYLKIDAQGYEAKILDGAAGCLHAIDAIQLEMSLVELYRGETLLPEMTARLYSLGYVLVSLEPGHTSDATGQLYQVDGLFHRSSIPTL